MKKATLEKIIRNVLILNLFIALKTFGFSQEEDSIYLFKRNLDSLFIEEVENQHKSDKVLHAEPLYIDLIRDLGARKGEREWNVGLGMVDNLNYDKQIALVEYEFAPIDRLGLEIELPFSFYTRRSNVDSIPSSKLNGLKLATQYSFFVSEKWKSSMAIGYIHEFELVPFSSYGKKNPYHGMVFNPFFVAAKRWGNNFHTLIYTGPVIEKHVGASSINSRMEINSNFHYMISGTRNFIGLELNKSVQQTDFDMTIRPQMRVGITENLLIGIVAGIPIKRENERLSTFARLIYEPKHKEKKHLLEEEKHYK